ncbi:MAG: biopolymer transporter ExbD [Rickettsiales bacterium]|jgi:biopolymer transport protein ExbD|nr:biopolymer transporter ExbD [Rickettsiales bacterium]
MKIPHRKDIRRARIEIIPMIDIMFFLLATIMLSSLQIQHQHLLKLNNIELPKVNNINKLSNSAVHAISITKSNIIFLDEVEINSDKIKEALNKLNKLENIDEITISADKDASHGVVINVIDIAKQSGFKHFAIATNNK